MKAVFLILSLLGGSGAQNPSPINYANYQPITAGRFANFTYPTGPVFEYSLYGDKRKSLTLKRGLFYPRLDRKGYIKRLGVYLKSVSYVDVTGDGRKEALVVLGTICDCSADLQGAYIYDLSYNQPKLLWAFPAGDRAEGGIHRIYGQSGDLIVELYGIGSGPRVLPKNWTGAQCCSKEYTRRRYRWNGNRFIQQGKARVLRVQ